MLKSVNSLIKELKKIPLNDKDFIELDSIRGNFAKLLSERMEEKLDALGIPKKDRAGALAYGMSGGSVPSAYKWQRTVNRFQIERKSSEWFLISASRCDIWGNAAASKLALTTKQRDIALAKFGQQFTVQIV